MLKLIISHTDNASQTLSFSKETVTATSHEPFSAIVFPKGPFLYLMSIQDPSHYLNCELILEIESDTIESQSNTVICHFPEISDEKLGHFIHEDDTLYDGIMTQYLMKILQQLFTFCKTHYATRLIIYTNDVDAQILEFYSDFLNPEGETYSQDEPLWEIAFPVTPQIHADLIACLQDMSLKFAQTLWQNQRTNQAMKTYLKSHPFG